MDPHLVRFAVAKNSLARLLQNLAAININSLRLLEITAILI
jgi:hypothetical protein